MGRAIGKNEEEVAVAMMLQIKNCCNPIEPPAISSDENDSHRVVYRDPNEVPSFLGLNTAYVERTNLTSRQMNGRMVRKTLSFSKEEEMLKASCALKDMVYNYGRPLKPLREESNSDQRQWNPRSPAMAAGITDHIGTIDEMMMLLVVPESINA